MTATSKSMTVQMGVYSSNSRRTPTNLSKLRLARMGRVSRRQARDGTAKVWDAVTGKLLTDL